MSAKNEHYLKRIQQLEEENSLLKQQYEVCNNNLKVRMDQLTLAQHELDYVYKNLSMYGKTHLAGEWCSSEERKVCMKGLLVNWEACGEDISEDTSERSIEKHKQRQEACAAFKEGS